MLRLLSELASLSGFFQQWFPRLPNDLTFSIICLLSQSGLQLLMNLIPLSLLSASGYFFPAIHLTQPTCALACQPEWLPLGWPYVLHLSLWCLSSLAAVVTAFHPKASLDQQTSFLFSSSEWLPLYFQGLPNSYLMGRTSKWRWLHLSAAAFFLFYWPQTLSMPSQDWLSNNKPQRCPSKWW